MKKFFIWMTFILFFASRFLSSFMAGSFWFDEAFSYKLALIPLSQMISLLMEEHNPLLHPILSWIWLHIFPQTIFSLRVLSILFAITTFWLLYTFCSRAFNKNVATFSAVLLTISSLFLYHQSEARMYSLLALLIVATASTFWSWYEKKNAPSLIGFTIASILLVHTHITAWAFLLAIYLFVWQKKRFNKTFFFSQVIVMISFLVWFIPVLLNKWRIGGISQGWFFSQTGNGYFFNHLVNFLMAGTDLVWVRSLMCALMVILLGLALLRIKEESWWKKLWSFFTQEQPLPLALTYNDATQFILLSFIVPLMLGFIVQINVSKYLLASGVMLIILLALGLERISHAWLQKTIIALLIVLTLPSNLPLLFQKYHHWDELNSELRLWQSEYPQSLTLVHSFAYELLLDKDIPVVPVYPLDDTTNKWQRIIRHNWHPIITSANVGVIQNEVSDHDIIILVSSTPGKLDPVKQWFWKNGWALKQTKTWSGYGDGELLLFRR